MLESFTEARSTSEATEAVTPGQLLDQATTSIQNPWDYEVLPSHMFTDQVCYTVLEKIWWWKIRETCRYAYLRCPAAVRLMLVRRATLKARTIAFTVVALAQISAIFAGNYK